MNIAANNWIFEMDCLGVDISPEQARRLLETCPDRSLEEAKFLETIAGSASEKLRKIA